MRDERDKELDSNPSIEGNSEYLGLDFTSTLLAIMILISALGSIGTIIISLVYEFLIRGK